MDEPEACRPFCVHEFDCCTKQECEGKLSAFLLLIFFKNMFGKSFWLTFVASWVQCAIKKAIWPLRCCKRMLAPERRLKVLFFPVEANFL